MTNLTGNATASAISTSDDELALICDDPASGQSLRFAQIDGRQVITYSYPASGTTQEIILNESEAAEIVAWRNSGRRASYWNWPGWDTVRERSQRIIAENALG